MSSPPSAPAKRSRTRTGCLNCRRKKRKCDERRPSCGGCCRRGQRCEWGVRLNFRAENARCLEGSHPSMARTRRRPPKEYEILDVTSDVIRDYNALSPPPIQLHVPTGESDDGLNGDAPSPVPATLATARGQAPPQLTDPFIRGTNSRVAATDSSPGAQHQTESAVANLLYFSQGGHGSPILPIGLDVTEYLDHQLQVITPDGSNSIEDGIFLPGSAYHELHSTLRNHLIQEVKSNAPTRQATPRFEFDDDNDDFNEESGKAIEIALELPTSIAEIPSLLSEEDECILWRNWFDEVAPWLDKFDNDRSFQQILPTMAPDHGHLRYSILAVSARQMELKQTTSPTDRSLALYQQAIHHLLPHLPSRSTAVIASCVILCVLEMMSCSPKAWQRHLDGCASLMAAVGINGFVGGVEQALFWCFARMDVCGGLISSVTTLIPVSHWASKSSNGNNCLDQDVQRFRAVKDFTGWSNYAVYLAAQVLDLLAPLSDTAALHVGNRSDPGFRARWLKLWRYISEWHDARPAPLLPVMTIPSSSKSPFPTVIFSNPAAISGNQLYHTASLLMLQNQPPGVRLSPRPRTILWHARRVCAISLSNEHHGAWTNGIQPLWIAGRCMSHPDEHRTILDLLDRIERESGWRTRWRAEDLKAYWGDLEE
ncbi:C6 zinc finger domain-containingprotein [Purpureocillium lavendulum]|uniref:C6 zinc finger domain-containingprotein n=1 Tax=Purpureocillium lavendulum TaxID=1247861 RepID=A0AB34G235_9HYPO|nr:C6 zinc finger domain-containingprotein [Purpureocillium lavendulum]